MSDARTIHLRRPPVLVEVEGRFVPRGVSLAEVDAAWESMRVKNPRLFDGPVLQVLGVHRNGHGGVQMHVQESSYRFGAVAALGLDCGARALGVKGFVQDRGRVLVGRRSLSVARDPGAWEFVPGGTLEPREAPSEAIARELREEARLEIAAPPIPVAVLFDETTGTWEIVYRLVSPLAGVPEIGWEYDEFRILSAAEAVSLEPLSHSARLIARLL